MATLTDDLRWRGLIHQATDPALEPRLDAGGLTVYIGFDPTAPSLHVGNLLQLCTLRRLQLGGHQPIALAGGGTGMIGDPGGRSGERSLLGREELAHNLGGIEPQLGRFLDFTGAGGTAALLLDNAEWLAPLSMVDYLRDIGKHFTVNQMVAKESVKARFERPDQGISYTEFSYMLLQAFDYLELFRRHDCRLQVGGSDQWGNLVAGVGLIRSVQGASVHALATPLITKPDGTKYGKTEGGAIWLSADLMPPYAFYQFWLNVSDAEVPGLLRVFSFRSREEIEQLTRESSERPAARTGQRALAQELTTLVHGAEETRRAIAASQALFGRSDLAEVDEQTLAAAVAEVPSVQVFAGADPQTLPTVVDLMAELKMVPSKSAARRAIMEGGAYLNNRKVTSEDAVPGRADLLCGRYLILRVGKRTVGAVEVVSS